MGPIQFSMKTIGVPLALVLLVLFYLSFSVSNRHQNLLLSVYDFLVVSNSKPGRFAFFVVFSFITVIVSFGSSKTPEVDLEWFFSQTSLLYESNITTIDIDDKLIYCSNNVDDNEHQGYDGSIEDNDEDITSDDIGSEEEDDDDNNDTDSEMEKRAEEFIAKVKQKWGEELLTDRLLCITAT